MAFYKIEFYKDKIYVYKVCKTRYMDIFQKTAYERWTHRRTMEFKMDNELRKRCILKFLNENMEIVDTDTGYPIVKFRNESALEILQKALRADQRLPIVKGTLRDYADGRIDIKGLEEQLLPYFVAEGIMPK